MKCLNEPCRAPVACGVFGYCRLRNFLTPEEDAADSLASYNAAMRAIGDAVRAGAPVPQFLLSRKARG